MFGIQTVVFRHSSMYGGNQHATYEQGWVGWFIQKALEIKRETAKEPFIISGNGKQVRDVLHVSDVVTLYFKAVENINQAKGKAFNIGGGIKNSLSLLELFKVLENELGIKMIHIQHPFRKSDQLVFIADKSKAENFCGWRPEKSFSEGIERMIEQYIQ